MNNTNLDHEDFLEAGGKFAQEDWDTAQEREEYERWLDELYEKHREERRKAGL